MPKIIKSQPGLTPVVIILIVVAAFLVGAGTVYLYQQPKTSLKQEALSPSLSDIFPETEVMMIESEELTEEMVPKEAVPVVEEGVVPVVENAMSVITFTVKDDDTLNILRDGKVIGELKCPEAKLYKLDEILKVIAQNKEYVYFSYLPTGGLGGYFMAGLTGTLYQIDLSNNKISKIAGKVGEIDIGVGELTFTPNLRKLFYNQPGEEKMRLVTLPNNTIVRQYSYPESYQEGGQFKNFKFSPQEDKMAFVGVLGPADEKSAVFILFLESGKFQLVEERLGKIFTVKGWIDNERVDYE